MAVSARDVREWILLFPRHPLAWLLAAGVLVFVLANRPRKANVVDEPPASSRSSVTSMSRSERVKQYAWLNKKSQTAYAPLIERIPVPSGAKRVEAAAGSYADWLRHLPCMPAGTPVRDGKGRQIRAGDDPAIAAVIDLHPSNRGLLNAANMAVRLRAEYLWSAGKMSESHFTFTSGDLFEWKRFAGGDRPTVHGRNVTWKHEAQAAETRGTFAAFMELLLNYSTSINLERDTHAADGEVQPGDLFVMVGRPGHAVVVLDVAVGPGSGRRALLGEGLTPPQSFHVLKNADGSAWFVMNPGAPIKTATWGTLTWRHWRRWPG